MTLDEGHLLHLHIVAITYGKVSLWLWKTQGIFFSYFVATLFYNQMDPLLLLVLLLCAMSHVMRVSCVQDHLLRIQC